MPSITGNVDSPSPHVPAWKKLGLKLKFAKDLPIHSEDSSNTEVESRKRKLVDDEIAFSDLHGVKQSRSKQAKRQSSPTPHLPVEEPAKASVSNDDLDGANAASIPSATPLKKRKSVAFTPETKLEDGDSTKQLFYSWIAEQIAKDSSFNPQALGGAFRTLEPRSIPESDTQEKVKEAKSKKKEKSSQKTGKHTLPKTPSTEHETAIHPAVTYLQQYHESRSSWKFNKAKQTYILKNLFDIQKLPSSLDPALTAYIEGLQGADARSRVKKAAEEIRDGDEKAREAVAKENMEDPVRRQEYYDSALKHFQAQLKGQVKEQLDFAKELDPEWRLKFLKRKRAERILWSMGDTLDMRDDAALPSIDRNGVEAGSRKTLQTNDGTARRRRKRRTGVPDDDESSSSSSSSDDSSEESSSADGTSSDSETSSESEEGTTSSDSSSTSSSSSSSSSGDSSKSADSDGESSDSDRSNNSD